jgi:bifunctional non-homologous end joining protein LigD
MVWDTGTWSPEDEDVSKALENGELKFTLSGRKLRGSWVLVHTRGYGHNANRSWLMIKHRDRYASTQDITSTQARSIASNRLLAEIARDGWGDVEKAASGDPMVGTRGRTSRATGTLRKGPRGRYKKTKVRR